jgi:putative nucleotidyltransferase with HDIG domain
MVSIRDKIRQRRESRRREPSSQATLWRRFRDGGGIGSLLLAGGLCLVAVAINVWPIDPLPYHHEGQYVPSDIYARVSFQVLSPKKMADEESRLKMSTPTVFGPSPSVAKFLSDLREFADAFKSTSGPSEPSELVKQNWAITPESLDAWRALRDPEKHRQFNQRVEELGKQLSQMPVVDKAQYVEQMNRGAGGVTILGDGGGVNLSKMKLLDVTNAAELDSQALKLAEPFDPPLRAGITRQLQNLLHQPTYLRDDIASAQAITDVLSQLRTSKPSTVWDAHVQGDLIVPKGDLTADQLALLQAEQKQFQDNQSLASPWWKLWPVLGRAATVVMILVLLAVYIFRYEREVVANHYLGGALAATMLAALVIGRATMNSAFSEPVSVMAVIMAAVVITIARNQRFALTVAIILSLLTVYQQRAGLGQFIVLLVGSAAAVLPLREIRGRSRLIEIGAFSGAAVLVSVFAVAAAAGLPLDVTFKHAALAAAGALSVGFLVLGILPVVERLFRVATSMTLLEWCDASKALLRRLSEEAPGTFAHSVQLGSMCEAAADAIGARGLLARAGAYYHDIGKINKSEYFVENQGGMTNPHGKLSPAMSLLIIIGHVKDGLELARQYGLPAVLREFIASHHGTTLVQYFYHAATEQRKADIDRAPDEVQFRYPGPKPRSKEAAILMLADASESSVRAMPEPSPGRIENQVHTMVTRRLMDGQLDECDLTLREVRQIEASLIRSICGSHHGRIAYPAMPNRKAAPADARPENGTVKGNGRDGDKPAPPEKDEPGEVRPPVIFKPTLHE